MCVYNNEVPETEIEQGIFSITTDVYTGPLDLLIDLIEKRKLLINDISIAAVTDEYMKYVALMERSTLRETADFVVLASTLLLIKSKSLLPVLELTETEEESVEQLQDRLRLYQIFRNAGKIVEQAFGSHILYDRTFVFDETPLFITDSYTNVSSLNNAITEVITRLPKKIVKPKVQVRKVVSLEEMIDRLKERVERQLSITFKDFTGNSSERATVIVGFLAVLEMVKQGSVIVKQVTRFTDIEIERDTGTKPSYM